MIINDEPCLKFRHCILFETESKKEIVWVSIDKEPKPNLKEVSIPFMSARYPPGYRFWSPMECIVLDGLFPDDISEMVEWIKSTHNSTENTKLFKKNLKLVSVDPLGNEIKSWDLLNCIPTVIENNSESLQFSLDFDRAFIL